MSVRGGDSLAEAFREATELAAETLGVARVGIWLFVDSRHAIRCCELFEKPKGAHSEGAMLYDVDLPTYFRALEERRYICADDARTHPLTRELSEHYLKPLGITSMLDAPIYHGGRVVGVVCHEHVGETRRSWTPADMDLAGSIADSLALRIEEAARRDAEERAHALHLQALELERLKAMWQLAANAAHDIRSMVNVVRWAARAITDDTDTTVTAIDHAKRILSATDAVVSITRDFEALGRERERSPSVTNPAAEIERLLPLLRAAVGENHGIALHRPAACGLVLVDRADLERMLLNLVVNARDALTEGGTIHIEVSESTVTDGTVPPGAYVVIEVSDHGVGIEPQLLEKIFQPFFTTKGVGSGTGLGLTVVQGTADRAGGFVHVESEPGRGTKFRVYLPRVAAP
jgi:two-component system cell cycle sensor histidine kinase/response regulator CckA